MTDFGVLDVEDDRGEADAVGLADGLVAVPLVALARQQCRVVVRVHRQCRHLKAKTTNLSKHTITTKDNSKETNFYSFRHTFW